MTPPGRRARAMRATAAGLSGNQCRAMAQTTASNAPSGTSISITSSGRSSTATSGKASSLAANTSSIPRAGSTPTSSATSKRRSIATEVKPVPQPTSSTRAWSPSGSDITSRRDPAMLWRTAPS
jgi:hypothetical protein